MHSRELAEKIAHICSLPRYKFDFPERFAQKVNAVAALIDAERERWEKERGIFSINYTCPGCGARTVITNRAAKNGGQDG